MSENLEIELLTELPKYFWTNEKYLLLRGCVKGIEYFKYCTLILNDEEFTNSESNVGYNKATQKVCKNSFQFLVELPSFKNEKEVNIELKIIANGEEAIVKLDSIPIEQILPQKIDYVKSGMVAVCMPLYQPNIKLFKQQLQSILQQSYQKVKIFIQDDSSAPTIFNEVKEYIKAFENVYLFRNDENIGFYKNVELLLNKIGDSFEYIALSDQDDVWELNKIEKQVNFLKQQQADLCYTDLKIVDENNLVLQHSFWVGRSNHLKKSFTLNLRNVATGSTMLFKQSILKTVLPFPQQIGKVFHDHYIISQLQNTNKYKVAYLNETLTNYVQHSDNVTGFSKFKVQNFGDKFISDIAFIKLFLQLVFKRNINSYEHLIIDSENFYHSNFQRLKLFLLYQNKLSIKQFFSNWAMIKIALQTFFISYKLYISNTWLNRFDAIIYKRILIQLALRLRYLFK